MSSTKPSAITSPYVPALDEVRAWIKAKIEAARFVELVAAILYLVTRMRDVNLALLTQLTQLRRARPRSETLRRVEAQMSLSFVLEVQPARLYVLRRLDERVACPHDDSIVSAKAPPQIVERGKLGDTLIIEAVADKYLEHLPTERQSRRFARSGVDVPPQTLGRSMAVSIDMVSPVARLIHTLTRAEELLGTDATGLPVLDRDHPLGIRNGTMWCWVSGRKWVAFFYARTGDAQSVKDFLGQDHRRTVQCDGTNLLDFLERAGGKRPGCWAHGRRTFVACARAGDTLALVPLRMLRRLFAVERLSAMHQETCEERLRRRTEHSAPVIAELRVWLDEQRAPGQSARLPARGGEAPRRWFPQRAPS